MPINPAALKQMLEIISPKRPKQVRMASGLGDIASTLRGGTQPAGQLLKQLAGRPGVKQGALSQVFGHVDPGTRLSPQDLRSQARSPRLYSQRGMTDAVDDGLTQELANNLIWGPHFTLRRAGILKSMLENVSQYGDDTLTQSAADALYKELDRAYVSPKTLEAAERYLGNSQDIPGIYLDKLGGDAYEMARAQHGGRSMKPAHQDYQRQRLGRLNDYDAAYFETVLRGTPGLGQQYVPRVGTRWDKHMIGDAGTDGRAHFLNPSQLGHVRGSITPEGRVFAEELQSDPLEEFGAENPQLSGIYGKLGRMLIDRSAEARVPSVSFPDANRIASVRPQSSLQFFRDVYDKRLAKELYDPLTKRGVPLRQENGWTAMDLPEGVLEVIRKDRLLNYRRGGRVR